MSLDKSKSNYVTQGEPIAKAVGREAWLKFRTHVEKNGAKSNITKYSPRRKWLLFTILLKLFGCLMWLVRLSVFGKRKALDLKMNEMEIQIPNLPTEFEGFEIVHLTDLHFDRVVGLEERIISLLKGRHPDLVVMTGDYKDRMRTPPERYQKVFERLGKNLKSKNGIYATLGNHDSADLVPVIEGGGIRVLINESIEITRRESKLTLTGLDDVHYFYTPEAIRALDASPNNACKILLVHSPEVVVQAAEAGFNLYLCGHTHAGQIALPNGKALITHVNTGKEFSVGRWKYKNLEGYTSSGAGVSGLTIRFFTQSEIAVVKLVRN